MSLFLRILFTILGAIYVLSPFDAVTDFVPILGQMDDLFVLGLVLYYCWKVPVFKKLLGFFSTSPGQDDEKRESDSNAGTQGTRQTSASDPYEILGVAPGAGPEEIKAAYRQISQKYHPDKVAHLGLEFQELAQKKFVEIQQAYETLRRLKGW